MKRKFVVVLITTMLLSLVGCSTQSEMDKFTGKWVTDGYENEKLGIKFTTPEGVTIVPKAELDAEESALYEGKSKEEIENLKKTKKVFYAFYPNQGVSIYVYVENLKGLETLDVDRYLAEAQLYYSQNPSLVPIFGAVYPSTIAGQDYKVLPFEISGTDYVQMLYARSEGDYMITYMVSYVKGSEQLAVKLIQAFESAE